MSAESPRHARSGGPLTVPAQPPPDRSIIDAVSGFINDVKLTSSSTVDPKDVIQWARFETADINEPTSEGDGDNDEPPLLLVLGYGSGVQVWLIPPNGEAQEVLSWRQGTVRVLRVLPTPVKGDCFASKRPLIALCDSASPGPAFCSLSFISIRGGEQVKSIKFKNPILDVLANKRSVVVSFSERFAVFDAGSLEDRMAVTTCYPCPCPLGGTSPVNPLALGDRWLAYADTKLNPSKRSSGGCEGEGFTSYTAAVLYAAKSLGRGLRGLGESVAQSLAGARPHHSPSPPARADHLHPGLVTIIDIEGLDEEDGQDSEEPYEPVVAHFVAHSDAVVALKFDASGLLLVTADRLGHDFHVFRLHPHPCGPALAAVHHLYVLHRGDTTAKVQDIAISGDARWVAVSTLRGTTHVFGIAPYGGAPGVRTHTQPRVVNRLSRFHRSAGLPPDPNQAQSDAWFPNPRLPPYPAPVAASALAQLRPTPNLATHTVTRTSAGRQRLSSVSEEGAAPLLARAAWGAGGGGPRAALFLLAAGGALAQLLLHPRPQHNIPKEKVCDESPIEVQVEAVCQWALRRGAGADVLAPLPPASPLLQPPRHTSGGDVCLSAEERWLSQVEIVTHAGPHRRLWMGPQFLFKTYNCTGSVPAEVSLAARSSPISVPPAVIDCGSNSSLEHSPSDSFRRKSVLSESGHATSVCDVQLKEDLAEAMKEDHGPTVCGAAGGGAVARAVAAPGWVSAAPAPAPTPAPASPAPAPDDTVRCVLHAAAAPPHRPLPASPLPRTTTIPVQPLQDDCRDFSPARALRDDAPTPRLTLIKPTPRRVSVSPPAALSHASPSRSVTDLDDDRKSVPRTSSPARKDKNLDQERKPTKPASESPLKQTITEASKENLRDAMMETPEKKVKERTKEGQKEMLKEAPKEKVKESGKETGKVRSKDSKETPKEKSVETVRETSRDTLKEMPKESPKEILKESLKEKSKETPKEGLKDKPKDKPKETAREMLKEIPVETPKDLPKETPKEILKETPKELLKDIFTETPKDNPKPAKESTGSKTAKDSVKRGSKNRQETEVEKKTKNKETIIPPKTEPEVKPTAVISFTPEPPISSSAKPAAKRESTEIKSSIRKSKERERSNERLKSQEREKSKERELSLQNIPEFKPKRETSEDKVIKELEVLPKRDSSERENSPRKDSSTTKSAWKKDTCESAWLVKKDLFPKLDRVSPKKDIVETKSAKLEEIKTEDQAWDMLLNEPDKPILSVNATEEKPRVKKNRKMKKSQDDPQNKSEDDSFVEIHAIEENTDTQLGSDELVSISMPYEELVSPGSYSSKTKKSRSPKPEKKEEPDAKLDEWTLEDIDAVIKTKSSKKKNEEVTLPETESKSKDKREKSIELKVDNFEIPIETAQVDKKSKYESRKSIEKESDVRDVYVIDSTKEEFPEIQITRGNKPRKKSPLVERSIEDKEVIVEKPAIKSWSSIAASKNNKKETKEEPMEIPEAVENVEKVQKSAPIDIPVPSISVSLQDELMRLCKRTDIMVAECDTPTDTKFDCESLLHDLPPLELDFGLDHFKLEVMRDCLLESTDTKITSPICKIDIDNIISTIKESTSAFNLIDLEKVPDKKEKGFRVIHSDKITSQEVKLEDDLKGDDKESEAMEKSSDDDNTSPVLSTDSDKEDKKSSGASNVTMPSPKQSSKSKKSRRKKK